MNKENKSSIFKRLLIAVVVAVFFWYIIQYCFNHLLIPNDDISSKTPYQLTNGYVIPETLKGNLYDRNGNTIYGYVRVQDSLPMRKPDGSLLPITEETQLTKKERAAADCIRVIIDEEAQESMSNVLPLWFGGLDSAFSIFLQDIPVNTEEETIIETTIDSQLQKDVFAALADKQYINAFVMDISNGDVLSMVSKPSLRYNEYISGSIPFTTYRIGNYVSNNVDNVHDCVQDYYKDWKRNCKGDSPKMSTSAWLAKLQDEAAVFLPHAQLITDANDIVNALNAQYGSDYSLDNCMTVNFEQIYEAEQAFYHRNETDDDPYNDNDDFDFTYEPESIKKGGEAYTPFVRLIVPDSEKDYYLKLFYGSNNFVYSDCLAADFDPNFSTLNYNVLPSAPGSCFKVLLTALLADSAPDSLIYDSDYDGCNDINVSWSITTQTAPLPEKELAEGFMDTAQRALTASSNQYFSVAAILLDDIMKTDQPYYNCTLERIHELCGEYGSASLNRSGSLLLNFYKDKFCIRSPFTSLYFNTQPMPSVLGCLGNIDTTSSFDEKTQFMYDATLWYNNDNQEQGFVDSGTSYAQKIGDTAYGQGYNQISPAYMAMVIGKCLTGKMYAPNLIHDNTQKPIIIGEDFNRPYTVQMMREHLSNVYNEHFGYEPESETTDFSQYTYFSKTGTSSVDKGKGTQNTYGIFGEKAEYPVQAKDWDASADDPDKYQTIWYTAAVSDGEHEYAVVLRSFFDNDSYSLRYQFLKIVDALHKNGYLN